MCVTPRSRMCAIPMSTSVCFVCVCDPSEYVCVFVVCLPFIFLCVCFHIHEGGRSSRQASEQQQQHQAGVHALLIILLNIQLNMYVNMYLNVSEHALCTVAHITGWTTRNAHAARTVSYLTSVGFINANKGNEHCFTGLLPAESHCTMPLLA